LLDRPINSSSPFSGSITVGTADNGARSERTDCVRARPGRERDCILGGLDDNIPVVEVGTGVGYFCCGDEVWKSVCRFRGLGKPGEEEKGSKAGRREGAGRFVPAIGSKGEI